jgi:hypothetical protein
MSDQAAKIRQLPRAFQVTVYFRVPEDPRDDQWWSAYLLAGISLGVDRTAYLAGTRLQKIFVADLPPEMQLKQ